MLNSDMTFTAVINGVSCTCLLDTGSNISIINQSVFDALPNGPPLRRTTVRAKTASQENLPLSGRTTLSFDFGGARAVVPVFVSDSIDVPCLLGLDFLQVCPCVIDVRRSRLVLAPPAAVRSISAEAVSVGNVVVGRDTVVSPGDEVIVRGFVSQCEYRGPAVVQPQLEIVGLEFVSTLVEVTGPSVPCVVRNVSTERISIPKRSELGQLEVGFAEQFDESTCNFVKHTCEKFDLNACELSDEQKQRARSVLNKHQDMFDGHIGFTTLVSHSIDTGDNPPVRQPPRRVPPHLAEEVKAQIDELVRQGVLEECLGSWASPICLVRRKNGKIRICADLRRLNSVTRPSSYPIPRVDESLEALSGSNLFCTLDMNNAYFQVGVDPRDKDKTAIITPFGCHRYSRMPFGCSGAPSTCARLLDIVLKDVPTSSCVHYFDDVVVHGTDFDEVLAKLDCVLTRLQDAGLTLNPEKCELFRSNVTFLGHVVSSEGVSTDPEKVSKILEWPQPRNVKELGSFLGLASYFRKYVPHFAETAAPLFRLTQKDVLFTWSAEAQSAFNSLKVALTNAPVLAFPRFGNDAGPFTLDCDASDEGVGAVLLQEQEGVDRVIAYGSHRLSKSQKNYSTTRKELLACVLFTQQFDHYLLGKKFKLRSDHASLQWLFNFKHPRGIIARWFEILAEFDFDIVFRPGAENVVADALSRRPADRTDVSTQTDDFVVRAVSDAGNVAADALSRRPADRTDMPTQTDKSAARAVSDDPTVRAVSALSWSFSYLREQQDQDEAVAEVTRLLSAGVKPRRRDVSEVVRPFLRQWSRLTLLSGVLYRMYRRRAGEEERLQVVVPESLVAGVLTSLHAGPAGGHFGAEKLLEQIRVRFWWPDMTGSVETFCRSCDRCNTRKDPVPRPRAAMGELYASEPFETVCIDFLSGLPTTGNGNKHLLVVCDGFTRWCETYPLPDMKATTVASTLVNEFFARFGCPRRLHSDGAANFTGAVLTETCRLLGVEKSKISPYHPEGNAKAERLMRTILDMLSKYLDSNHSDWDIHLPLLMLGYRAQIHSSLGYSPYYLMFAREPRLPAELELASPVPTSSRSVAEYVDGLCASLRQAHHFAISASDRRHARNKRAYEGKLNEFSFEPGDAVYLHKAVVPAGQYYKFLRPWKAATVLRKVGDLNYRVRLDGNGKTILVHHNRLKPRVTAPSSAPEEPGPGAVDVDVVAPDGRDASLCAGLAESGGTKTGQRQVTYGDITCSAGDVPVVDAGDAGASLGVDVAVLSDDAGAVISDGAGIGLSDVDVSVLSDVDGVVRDADGADLSEGNAVLNVGDLNGGAGDEISGDGGASSVGSGTSETADVVSGDDVTSGALLVDTDASPDDAGDEVGGGDGDPCADGGTLEIADVTRGADGGEPDGEAGDEVGGGGNAPCVSGGAPETADVNSGTLSGDPDASAVPEAGPESGFARRWPVRLRNQTKRYVP